MHVLKEFLRVLANPMALFGVIGQTIFFSRFLIQWIASEKKKESHIPLVFWYLSIGGALLTLVYAVWRRDPVFSIAQVVGLFVYVRNLMLIQNSRKSANAVASVE
jgi:lipid-A-disaccharide synthase-like uncharacterized protein